MSKQKPKIKKKTLLSKLNDLIIKEIEFYKTFYAPLEI